MPHKSWGIGEEVLAVDMNSYLQNQVVATFPTAAARASAITTPVKGQCSTRDDLPGVVEVWDGSAWVAGYQSPTASAWSTYTPVWRAGGSAAGLSVGTGGTGPGLNGYYRMIAPYVMALLISFRCGTTGFNGGTGSWDFSYPPGTGTVGGSVGSCIVTGGQPYLGSCLFGGTVINAGVVNGTGVPNWWSATHPLAWTNSYVGQLSGVIGIPVRWLP